MICLSCIVSCFNNVKPFRKRFAELFGFDRRERRGTYVLAVMLVVLLLVRVFTLRPDTEHLNDELIAPARPADLTARQAESSSAALFTFDPNTASLNDLVSLGLTVRRATMPDTAGEPETAVSAVAAAATVEIIDLNSCTASDLLRLPGIGPVLSERIIRYRGLLGGFVDPEQLYEVYGLDSSVVILISATLTLTYDSVKPIMLDSCSFSEMARHPYIGSSTARLIAKYRSLMDTPVTLGDMVRQKVMTPEQALRLAPYVWPSPDAAGEEYEFILSKVLK